MFFYHQIYRQIFGINSEKSTSEDHREVNRNTHDILENGTVIQKFLALSWTIEISMQYLLLCADILSKTVVGMPLGISHELDYVRLC